MDDEKGKFAEHLKNASKVVAGWPEWKQKVMRIKPNKEKTSVELLGELDDKDKEISELNSGIIARLEKTVVDQQEEISELKQEVRSIETATFLGRIKYLWSGNPDKEYRGGFFRIDGMRVGAGTVRDRESMLPSKRPTTPPK